MVPREPVHEGYNIQIELIQGHIEIDYELVKRVIVIRDLDIQVLVCGCGA